jgi:IS6 family transposase
MCRWAASGSTCIGPSTDVEADHGALKRVIRPTCGSRRAATVSATIKSFEAMRMIRRGHCILQQLGATGEIRLVNQLFGLAA